jgi:hypothetical protein
MREIELARFYYEGLGVGRFRKQAGYEIIVMTHPYETQDIC